MREQEIQEDRAYIQGYNAPVNAVNPYSLANQRMLWNSWDHGHYDAQSDYEYRCAIEADR